MKFIKENLNTLLTILFLVLIGILLLVDPATFGITIIKVAGVLFAALGIFDLVKYFRADPAEALREYGQQLLPLDALSSLDALILTVGHNEYRALTPEDLEHGESRRALRLAVVGVAFGSVAEQVAPAVVAGVIVLLLHGCDEGARFFLAFNGAHMPQKAGALFRVFAFAGSGGNIVFAHVSQSSFT